MRVTWKDAITTISTGGAIVLERAYFHNYDWPLVSSMRWVIGGLALLALINLAAGFAFDRFSKAGWDFTGIALGIGVTTLTALGLIFVVSDYVVLLMLSTVIIWLVSIAHHFIEHTPQALHHA